MAKSVTINYDAKFISETAGRIIASIKGPELLNRIGLFLKRQTKENFNRQANPFGDRWKPSLAAIRENRKTLIKTGNLQNSFEYSVSGKALTVGTNVDYAVFHQLGTSKLPKRDFLGIGDRDAIIIENIIGDFLEEASKG